MISFFRQVFFCIATLFVSIPAFTDESRGFSFHGTAGLGFMIQGVDVQPHFAGFLDASFDLRCHRGPFCQKYQLKILTTELRLALANDRSSSNVPYLDASLQVVQFRILSWLEVGTGALLIQRNPRFLDTAANLTAQIAEVRVGKNLNFRHGALECKVNILTLGAKYVKHQTQSVPYVGLALVGVAPGCEVRAGRGRVEWNLGAKFGLQTSVGVSGDGTPDIQGHFGSILLEPWVDIRTRLQVGLKNQSASLLAWYVQGDFRYQALIDFGTKSIDRGYFIGFSTGLLFQ